VIANDSSLILLDANATQLVIDRDQPCARNEPSASGIALAVACGDGKEYVYLGRRRLGENHELGFGFVALDPASGRAAMTGDGLTVVDRDGKVIARSTKDDPSGSLAFADTDHLLVLDPRKNRLDRWDLAARRWDHVADVPGSTVVAVAAGGTLVGTLDGHVAVLRDGREVHRVALGTRIDFLTPSEDGRWAVAQLGNGGTVILDGATGDPVRTFATGDSVGLASILDPTGELVLRPSRGALTVWERATGDELIWSLDLMKIAVSARFTADGRLELGGFKIGLLDLPRDTRPVAQILHDIECKVPFKVVGSRLEPSAGCGT